MDVSILQHSVEDFRSHANRERIPTQIYLDSSQACQVIGDEIIYQINQREKNQAFVLGLATGSTPIKVYQHLIRAYQAGEVSFSNVHSFNLDEYFPMDPQSIHSYVEFMHKNLFDHIDIPKENIHIPDGTIAPEEIDDYCKSYEETIESLGGIDIQLLGIGRTGHIGFNEPGSAIHSKTRRVWLDPITRKDAASSFFGEQFVPQQAITMGADTIMKAKKVYLMAWGEGKSNIICRTVEGTISDQVPATFLQQHNDCVFILDNASASELTRQKTPWLVGSCKWDSEQIKKAVIWLARHCEKSILKLSREDYENNHLQSLLVAINYEVYQLNYKIHQSLLEAFDVWDSNKNSNQNTPHKALVFSPHPDDDVISMGGTLIQLADNGFDVHVAYQTSGNIAVYDDEVIRFMQFCLEMNPDKHSMEKEYQNIVSTLANKKIGDIDSLRIQELKGLIRKGEALAACRVCSVPENNAHFMNLPFYETGAVKKKPHQKEDVDLTIELLRKVKPEKIFAAGDLSDPHGTHRVCLQVIFDAIDARGIRSVENNINLSYFFDSKKWINLRLRNYWSRAKYDQTLFLLNDNGKRTETDYSILDFDPDTNFNIWNLDINFELWFAPGSNLVLLYRNQLFNRDTATELDYLKSLGNLFDQTTQHQFSLRINYLIDFNSLRKKNKSS